MHYLSLLVQEWARRSLVGEYDMPRISETLTLATKTYKPTRPQNGDTPALFREVNTSKKLAELNLVNVGVTQSTLQSVAVFRPKVTIVLPPALPADGTTALPANRLEFVGRIIASSSETQVDEYITMLSDLVSSSEFKALLLGDAQF